MVGGGAHRLNDGIVPMCPTLLKSQVNECAAFRKMRIAPRDVPGMAQRVAICDDYKVPLLLIAGGGRLSSIEDDLSDHVVVHRIPIEDPARVSIRQAVQNRLCFGAYCLSTLMVLLIHDDVLCAFLLAFIDMV